MRKLSNRSGSAYSDVESVRLLLEAGADKDVQDMNGRTALMEASLANYAETVRLLLEARADTRKQDQLSRTALDCALSCGHTELAHSAHGH